MKNTRALGSQFCKLHRQAKGLTLQCDRQHSMQALHHNKIFYVYSVLSASQFVTYTHIMPKKTF